MRGGGGAFDPGVLVSVLYLVLPFIECVDDYLEAARSPSIVDFGRTRAEEGAAAAVTGKIDV